MQGFLSMISDFLLPYTPDPACDDHMGPSIDDGFSMNFRVFLRSTLPPEIEQLGRSISGEERRDFRKRTRRMRRYLRLGKSVLACLAMNHAPVPGFQTGDENKLSNNRVGGMTWLCLAAAYMLSTSCASFGASASYFNHWKNKPTIRLIHRNPS